MKKLVAASLGASLLTAGLALAAPGAYAGPATGHVEVGQEYGATLRNMFKQNVDGSGYSWKTYGSGACTTSTTTADFGWSDMNTRSNWSDVVSYAYDYNYCDTRLFRLTGFNDPLTSGYVNYGSGGQSFENSTLNNKTSSYYLS